jgi:DNA polymerase III gamma/tau subunit
MEFYSGLVQHFRTLLVLEVSGRQSGLGLLPEEEERLSAQASAFGRSDLVRILSGLTQIETQAKATQHPRALLEVTALDIIESRSVAARAPADPVQTATEGAPDPPRTSDQPMSPDALWAELRLRINEHKPMLVGFLDLGRPLSLSGDTLTIVLPARQKAAAEKIEANLETLDAALTDIAGRKLSLVVKVATKPGPDPVHQRVTRILGDVEETEKP